MDENFVTVEIAKKLKEKGFRKPCVATYDNDGMLGYNYYQPKRIHAISFDDCLCISDDLVLAPTISQVLKWLREEKKIHIEPCILADCDTDADGKIITQYTYWSFSIISIETGDMLYCEYKHMNDRRFNSFEEAALPGIEYTLDNLI